MSAIDILDRCSPALGVKTSNLQHHAMSRDVIKTAEAMRIASRALLQQKNMFE